jgi:hypothetical protein
LEEAAFKVTLEQKLWDSKYCFFELMAVSAMKCYHKPMMGECVFGCVTTIIPNCVGPCDLESR